MFARIFITILVVLLCATSLPAQNLVQNGDFESPWTDTIYCVGPGEQLDSWTVSGDSVDVLGNYWQPAHGRQSIDLNGNQPGGVFQYISALNGALYNLSFAVAANPESSSVKIMEVWWGDSRLDTLSLDPVGHSVTDMGWAYYHYCVVGSGNDRLAFVSTGPAGCFGPALDDVSVVAPEPCSLFVLAGSVGSFGLFIRRRR